MCNKVYRPECGDTVLIWTDSKTRYVFIYSKTEGRQTFYYFLKEEDLGTPIAIDEIKNKFFQVCLPSQEKIKFNMFQKIA